MIEQNFAGLDNFIWWLGVVENRNDPMALGRCQIRFYGFHSDSLTDIPSADLPWALPAQSLNAHTFSTPKESDVVFGFFADGKSKQIPIMIGIIPGYPSTPNNTGVGYNDLRSASDLNAAPRPPKSRKYNTDGTGIIITENTNTKTLAYPRSYQLFNTSISSLATNLNIPANSETVDVMLDRTKNLDLNVNTSIGKTWSEPVAPYNPKYPYNQVLETESGHVFEMDDTFKNERISMMHRTGTFWEMYPDGCKVEKVTKSNYKVVMAAEYIHVMGTKNETIDTDNNYQLGANLNVLIGNNSNVIIGGDSNVNIKGNNNVIIGGDCTVTVTGNCTIVTSADAQIVSAGNTSIHASGNVEVTSQGTANVNSQTDINLQAANAINIVANNGLYLSAPATGDINIHANNNILLTTDQASIGVNSPGGLNMTQGGLHTPENLSCGLGASGSWQDTTGQTIQCINGIVTNIF
jgi:hypothetical protein